MRRSNVEDPELVVAKWKTVLSANEEHLGIIQSTKELELRFPILHSPSDVPKETRVLWGLTNKLDRCTAVTLPVGAFGTASRSVPGVTPSARAFGN